MLYEISEKAQDDIDQIVDYLFEEWSIQVLEDFYEKLQNAISILCKQEVIFQKYRNTEFHQFRLTKHNTIIYDYRNDILQIHRIIQNFQDPDGNLKSITNL